MRVQFYPRLTLRGRRWFWRARARNGEIVAQGRGYHRLVDAQHAVDLLANELAGAEVEIGQ